MRIPKRLLIGALTLVVAATASGVGAAGATVGAPGTTAAHVAPQGQRVTITTPSAGLHEMPLVTGLRRGYYAEEGLDVTRVQMVPPVSIAAVIGGEGDYGLAVGSATTAIVGADAPLKLVAGLAVRALQVLVVGDPAVRAVTDLRGRAIGTATAADTTVHMARLALRAHGLELQTDVAVQPLGESPNRLAALQTGQVGAVMLDLALANEAELRGGRILVAPSEFPPFPTSGVVVTEARLRAQPQQVEAVLRATLRGLHFMLQNRDETVALMIDHMALNREAAEVTYDLGMAAFAPDGVISDTGLQLLIDGAREASGRPGGVTPAQIADFTIVRRVAAQLGQ